MKKYVYFFILFVCSLFLLACGNSETAEASKLTKYLLNSEESEVVIPDEETVESEEGTEEVTPEE